MILFLLAYLGGVLTIVSPRILPVLPFVFAKADWPFLRSGLPLLAGMAALSPLSPRSRRSAAAGFLDPGVQAFAFTSAELGDERW